MSKICSAFKIDPKVSCSLLAPHRGDHDFTEGCPLPQTKCVSCNYWCLTTIYLLGKTNWICIPCSNQKMKTL